MTPPGGPAPLDEEVVLSPEWVTEMLQPRYPGAKVASTSVTERLETVATKIRYRLDYAEPIDGAPPSLCAKGYFNPAAQQRLAGTQPETIFYQSLAAELSVRTPPCVHAAIDEQTGHGLVIMEDLKDAGATFLDPLSTYGAEQAAATLEQLAILHASRWGELGGGLDSTFPPRLETLVGYLPTETLQTQLNDGRVEGVDGSVLQAGRVQDAVCALAKVAKDGPGCLVHGDVHTGNVYELANGSPGIIDWQVVQWGSWALDVAYHVGAVLEPDERERSERQLVEHYVDALSRAGVSSPAKKDAWWAYRAHLPYGFFMWGITRAVDRPIVERHSTRLGHAVAFHGSLDLLGV